ncbi:MAG: DUF2924 domain-containing protein [Rhodoblastus sp.]
MAARTTGDRSSSRTTDPLHQAADFEQDTARIGAMNVDGLRAEWRRVFGSDPPPAFSKDLLARAIAYRLQEQALGGLSPAAARLLRTLAKPGVEPPQQVKVGSVIVREHKGIVHEVLVVPGGFCWQGKTYDSLSTIAKKITGVTWNGPRFFGLRSKKPEVDDTAPAPGASVATAVDVRPRPGRRSSLRSLAGPSGAIR